MVFRNYCFKLISSNCISRAASQMVETFPQTINATDIHGNTALHYAAVYEDRELAKCLLYQVLWCMHVHKISLMTLQLTFTHGASTNILQFCPSAAILSVVLQFFVLSPWILAKFLLVTLLFVSHVVSISVQFYTRSKSFRLPIQIQSRSEQLLSQTIVKHRQTQWPDLMSAHFSFEF